MFVIILFGVRWMLAASLIVVKVEVSSKRSEILAGPAQIDNPKGLTNYADRVFIVEDEGVFEVGDRKEKVIEKEWEGDILAYGYTGNIYVIDKHLSTIYRYVGAEGEFSSKRDWMTSGVEVDLSGAKTVAIDGVIYILYDDGDIDKFSLGNLVSFSIADVYPSYSSLTSFYTNEELKHLYLLDSEGGRVIVIDKEGKYKAQYLADGISGAKGLVVSEEEKIILLLTGEKLVSIEMEHL